MSRFPCAACVAALVLAAAGCSGAAAPGAVTSAAPASAPQQGALPAPDSGALERLFERYWDAYLELNPLAATASGDHRHDDRLENSLSPQYLADSLALEQRALAELQGMPAPSEKTPARLSYELFKRERELAIEGYLYPEELFPVNPFEGLARDFAVMGSGAGPQPFTTAKDYENWLLRIDGFAVWTRQAVDNLRSGMRRGYLAPRALVEELLVQFAALAEDSPANPFYRPLAAMPSAIDEPTRTRLAERLTAAIRTEILPAYRSLHDVLQNEYLPLAPAQNSWSRLPLGEAWYAYLVRKRTGTQLTPAQAGRLCASEVERVRGLLQAALNDAGFSGSPQVYFDQLRHDPHAGAGTTAELLNAYLDWQTRIDAAAPAVLASPPAAPAAIRAAPRFLEIPGLALSYRGATPDGAFPAALEVNTTIPVRGFQIAPLLLGAYLPGRHAQRAAQLSARDLPRFRRFRAESAFADAWALYAQSLGEEMGLTREPAARFGVLQDELAHAAAAVVDGGLHTEAWSRAAALDYLHAQLPIDDAAASAVVDRALAGPAQALGAEIGALRIRELRRRAEEKLGNRFDLRAFHAALLEPGPLPSDLLEQSVGRWIDAANAQARP
jgi:uncharacterized protein (DUF885 family)